MRIKGIWATLRRYLVVLQVIRVEPPSADAFLLQILHPRSIDCASAHHHACLRCHLSRQQHQHLPSFLSIPDHRLKESSGARIGSIHAIDATSFRNTACPASIGWTIKLSCGNDTTCLSDTDDDGRTTSGSETLPRVDAERSSECRMSGLPHLRGQYLGRCETKAASCLLGPISTFIMARESIGCGTPLRAGPLRQEGPSHSLTRDGRFSRLINTQNEPIYYPTRPCGGGMD